MATAMLMLLDDMNVCSLEELIDVSGLTDAEVALLVDSGVLLPVDAEASTLVFHLRYIVVAKTARRLRDDFELDGHGLALALTLLRRLREAEADLAAVHAQSGNPHPDLVGPPGATLK